MATAVTGRFIAPRLAETRKNGQEWLIMRKKIVSQAAAICRRIKPRELVSRPADLPQGRVCRTEEVVPHSTCRSMLDKIAEATISVW